MKKLQCILLYDIKSLFTTDIDHGLVGVTSFVAITVLHEQSKPFATAAANIDNKVCVTFQSGLLQYGQEYTHTPGDIIRRPAKGIFKGQIKTGHRLND